MNWMHDSTIFAISRSEKTLFFLWLWNYEIRNEIRTRIMK